ncbi:MAG: DNA repair protein RecN [Chitinophagaceae bacterium]
MLAHLYIKNYILIEETTIRFQNGFTTITGETGAGKSVILGALSLLLGDRVDNKSLLREDEKAIIEAQFNIENKQDIIELIAPWDIDFEDELIIRKEINPNGKSRNFINDTPVSLSNLQLLGAYLVDMHKQFDTLELKQEETQLNIYDKIIQLSDDVNFYTKKYVEWKAALKEYENICAENIVLKKEQDYHQFMYDEISSLQLQENEIENIEKDLFLLSQSEQTKSALQLALQLLDENENPITSQLKQAIQTLEQQAAIKQHHTSLLENLQSALVEIKESVVDIQHIFSNTHYDEEKIQVLSDRLNTCNHLLKKHHVQDTASLIKIQEELEIKLQKVTIADEEEQRLKRICDDLFIQIQDLANTLTQKRKKEISNIEHKVTSLLAQVGMPNAQFKIEHSATPYHSYGADKLLFILDANKTGKYKPIYKAISGGELSRLMLCIKSLTASAVGVSTLVFDEIDTGISGETAVQVALLMQQLSTSHQIISITHLPQIAAKAATHLFVYKSQSKSGTIQTHIKQLNDEERIETLSEMLHGKEKNKESQKLAKTLLSKNVKY